MGIKIDTIITIEEFKGSSIYDTTLGENTTGYKDNYIIEAITRATMNMESISNYKMMSVFRGGTLTDDQISWLKMGACRYVAFLLRKGVEDDRGSSSSSLGDSSFSTTNPEDPFYIPQETITALGKCGLLDSLYMSGTFSTPAQINDNLINGETKDPTYEDGNYAITIHQANGWYVRYDRVMSPDQSIKISIGNDVDAKVLSLSMNLEKIVDTLEQDPKFVNIVLSAFMKNFDKFVEAVFNDILKEDTLLDKLTQAIIPVLEDDGKFQKIMEGAISKLMENDSKFKKDLANDPNFLAIVIDSVAKQIQDLIEASFNQLANESNNDTLITDNKTLTKAINELQTKIDKLSQTNRWAIGEIMVARCGVDISAIPGYQDWVLRRDMPDDFAIIKGNSTGTAAGAVRAHNHGFSWDGTWIRMGHQKIGESSGGSKTLSLDVNAYEERADGWFRNSIEPVQSFGGENNYAAGLRFSIWEYLGPPPPVPDNWKLIWEATREQMDAETMTTNQTTETSLKNVYLYYRSVYSNHIITTSETDSTMLVPDGVNTHPDAINQFIPHYDTGKIDFKPFDIAECYLNYVRAYTIL